MQHTAVGPYQLVERLAQGAFGAVFRAVDPQGQEVALKLLQVAKGSALERFQREAQCLIRLRHPNVVGAYDAGVDQGRPYLALELVEGEPLSLRVHRQGPVSPAEAVRLGMKLASALAHVHEQGLVHRDVKPDNVLIDAQGEPRLTDFGLAHDVESVGSERLTRSGVCLGTPGYWPPEQAAGELAQLGPEADVYALGATLWALLVGLPPFEAASFNESVRRTLHHPPEPVSSRRDGVPPGLDAVILRCMAKDPARRYPDMRTLEAALETCLEAPGGRAPRLLVALALLALAAALGATVHAAVRRRTAGSAVAGVDTERTGTGPGTSAGTGAGAGTDVGVSAGTDAVASAGTEPAEDGEAVLEGLPDPELNGPRALIAQEDLAGAASALTALLQRRPDLLAAWLDLGIVRLRQEQLASAREAFEAALKLVPRLSEALVWRGLVRAKQGQMAEGLADLTQALARDPDLSVAHVRRRPLAFEFPHQARDDLGRLMELAEPGTAEGCLLRGRLRVLRGDAPGGERDARRALELEGESAAARSLLGQALWAQKRHQEGYDAWTRALELDPGCREALHDRAEGLRGVKRYKEALADLDRLNELVPREYHYLTDRAAVRDAQRDYPAALRDLDVVLGLRPTSVRALLLRARARERTEDLEGALRDLRAVLEVVPDHVPALYEQLDPLLGLERAEEAMQIVRRLEATEADKPRLIYQRGRTRRALDHDLAEIEAEFERLVKLDPRPGIGWLELGLVRGARADWKGAQEALTRAVKATPQGNYSRVFLAAFGGDREPLRAWLKAEGWQATLAGYVLEELDELELLRRAGAGSDARAREQRCEAWCYVGIRAEQAGDLEKARACYQASVDTGVRRFMEWMHARDRLQALR